ncbi:MAG: hypothetical protein QXE92_02610 [Thermofilaceae archaeon]
MNPSDELLLAVAAAIVVTVQLAYAVTLRHLAVTREERDIYLAVYSSFLSHFAIWGAAEGYLLSGVFYLLGYGTANTIDIAYWTMAWCISVAPFAVLVLVLVYYFCYGFKQEAKTWIVDLIAGVPPAKVVEKIAGLTVGDTCGKLLLKTLLATIAGWTAGNIVQDRLSGIITVMFAKTEVKPLLWLAYSTFLFDPVGALVKWILPIVAVNAAFFASVVGFVDQLISVKCPSKCA